MVDLIKKKKQKLSKTVPTNPNIFIWSAKRKEAALLISEGTKNYNEIASVVRVRRETLWEWRRHPIFQKEVSRLTLENEKATREGLLRLAFKAIEQKMANIGDDRSTVLEWAKFISELQGHVKQKVELDANLKHEIEDPEKMTDEELQQAIKDELRKISASGYIPDIKKD